MRLITTKSHAVHLFSCHKLCSMLKDEVRNYQAGLPTITLRVASWPHAIYKSNDLTRIHILFPWLPKVSLPKRKLVIQLIRGAQHCLLKFINFNLSMAVCQLKLNPSLLKLTLTAVLGWGFKLEAFSLTVPPKALSLLVRLFLPLTQLLLTNRQIRLSALMRDLCHICQVMQRSCFVLLAHGETSVFLV